MDKLRIKSVIIGAATTGLLAVPAFATEGSGSTMTEITSALTTNLATVQSNALSVISTVLPYALGVMGAGLVIRIGIRVFRSVAK